MYLLEFLQGLVPLQHVCKVFPTSGSQFTGGEAANYHRIIVLELLNYKMKAKVGCAQIITYNY